MDIADIEKIAGLANLELTQQEKETFTRQFSDILDYFKILEKAPLDQAPAELVGATGSGLSEDVAVHSPVKPEDFSPYLENRHYKVPRVIE